MNNKTKRVVVYAIGSLIFLIGILAYVNTLFLVNRPEHVFWASYLIITLIGIGILIRNDYLVVGCLNIIFIPYIIWTFDFLFVWLTGGTLLGITNYFFEIETSLGQIISLQHLFTVPLSLVALSIIKVKKGDYWKLSLLIISLMFLATILITSPENNINCVFSNCASFDVPSPLYQFLWFVFLFVVIFLSNKIITNLDFLSSKKN